MVDLPPLSVSILFEIAQDPISQASQEAGRDHKASLLSASLCAAIS